jgi:hypothetical protein
MQLANVDMSEISVQAVYVICCFLCDQELSLSAEISTVGDAAVVAASQGWHSYEISDESCSVVCPSCIKEVQQNEAEESV